MKFLMKVGDKLDLNVAYNGGAADSGLIYTTPEGIDVVSVDINTGVVEALAVGDTVVRVYNNSTPSLLVATLQFEVCLASQYAERLAIRQGDSAVVIGSAVVVQELAAVGTLFAYQPQPYGMTIETYIGPGAMGLISAANPVPSAGSVGLDVKATSVSHLNTVFKDLAGNYKNLMIKSVKIKFNGQVDYVNFHRKNDNTGEWEQLTVASSLIKQDGTWSTFIFNSYIESAGFRISPGGAAITANGYWEIKDIEYYA